MKDIIYSTIDKSNWPTGEWTSEPDKIQYTDEKTGFPCLIVRHDSSGHLCGYVGINSKHPLFEKDYDDESVDVNVHGGLTFSSKCDPKAKESEGVCHKVEKGEDDNVWWFGFDCAHSGDTSPAYHRQFNEYDSYKNIDYVKFEIKKLAEQLKTLQS